MAKRKVTSRQVAKRAGVSQTTVSFVLNDVNDVNISETTRQRVLRAARELGYVPNAAARSLALGRPNNIGLVLICPHDYIFIDDYIPNIITGLYQTTRRRGFRILLEITDEHRPDSYLELIKGNEIAGMIALGGDRGGKPHDALIPVLSDGFPVVFLHHSRPPFYSVSEDDLIGVRNAVAHLVKLGHRRIACITFGPTDTDRTASERLLSFRQALESFGIPFDEDLVREGAYDPQTGYRAMESLLDQPLPPTALFAMNDVMAFGAMSAIQEHGLSVPDDVAVVGYNDWRLTRYTNPPLTTVRATDIEQGRCAGEMVLDLIDGKQPHQPQVTLKTKLIIRESCGARRRQRGKRRDG
jgi:DNA-binding LacI/PurR family transcriptional regulator